MKKSTLKRSSKSNMHEVNVSLWSVVAFQDEITRSLNLSDPSPKARKRMPPRNLPPIDSRSSSSSTRSHFSSLSSPLSHPSPTSLSSPLSRHSPTSLNSPLSSHFHSSSPLSSHPPHPPLPSRSRPSPPPLLAKIVGKKGERKEEKEEDIVVLEQKKYQLTLAQKMGLSPAPPMPLSHEQWEEVKKISDSRHDSYMPCVICQDDFRSEGQVLLSCSHVFHKICLDSFERFSKTKSCPLCRKEEYQKAQITEGKKIYLHKCATKIQAVYRGYRARKLFQQIMDSNPPEDPTKRKAFFARKLEKLTDKLLMQIEHDRAAIDSSIMSHNVQESIAYLRSVGIGSMLNPNSINWKDVYAQAKARNTCDCPICIMPLSGQGREKKLTLLSCSHVFHDTCISSFENYNCETVQLCPVCRSMYHKTNYVL